MTTEVLSDRWLKSKVELEPEERVLERGYFWYRVWWWQWTQGRLHLTTKRLIWIRNALNVPVGPWLVEVPLGDIKRFERQRPPPVSWQRALMVETADGERHWFSPLPLVEDLGAWSEAIASAMGAAKPK